MRIAVGSAFRNAGHFVNRYLNQVDELRTHVGADHFVRMISVEGDSTDLTRRDLLSGVFARGLSMDLRTCNHGGPVYGSTEQPERMRALSQVGNAILDGVRATDDVLVYVESDLIWDAHTIGSLIDIVMRDDADVVSPLIMAGSAFYDIWGFRKSGNRFIPFPPYHPELNRHGLTLGMDSVGSCLVMKADVARLCRIRNDNALVGLCEDIRRNGFRIAAHADFKVYHP